MLNKIYGFKENVIDLIEKLVIMIYQIGDKLL
jgi:hypothetical protein